MTMSRLFLSFSAAIWCLPRSLAFSTLASECIVMCLSSQLSCEGEQHNYPGVLGEGTEGLTGFSGSVMEQGTES